MKKPILYMMCGIPGSGKSTWAKEYLASAQYVSRDEIRYSMVSENEEYFSQETEVFNTFINTIVDGLKAGNDVVADATHINFQSRNKTINSLKNFIDQNEYEIIIIYMNTGLKLSKERNNNRKGRACVPEKVINSMYCATSAPDKKEFKNIKAIWEIKEGLI